MNERFRRLRLLAAIAAGFLAPGNAAHAHHSTALYSNEILELQGQLVDIQWQNPHIKFALKTVSAAGVETVWHLLLGQPLAKRDQGNNRNARKHGISELRSATMRY